jgi:hypothetical protein
MKPGRLQPWIIVGLWKPNDLVYTSQTQFVSCDHSWSKLKLNEQNLGRYIAYAYDTATYDAYAYVLRTIYQCRKDNRFIYESKGL